MRLPASPIRVLLFCLCIIFSPLSAQADDAPVVAGDAPHGALLFSTRCSTCHFFDANKFGPSMHGLYGRKSGSVEGYEYSPALKNLNVVWNGETLDKWLTNPSAMAPGTKMSFKVPNEKDRADIIAYLRTLALPGSEK